MRRPRERCPVIDVERLRRLWGDSAYTRAEIARELGLTYGQLHGAVERAGLPNRPKVIRTGSMVEMSEKEIWERAAVIKAQTLALMAMETEKATERRLYRERRAAR